MLSKWLVVNWLTSMDNQRIKCIKQTQVDTLMMTWITLVNTGQHWLTPRVNPQKQQMLAFGGHG